MRCRLLLVSIPLFCASLSLSAGDLAVPTVAKFLRLILPATGARTVACTGKELSVELANLGVGLNPESKCAWVETDKELPHMVKDGRVVICGSRSMFAGGASMAVVAEGGRPVIYVNLKALSGLGVTLPDNIMKIAKVAQ